MPIPLVWTDAADTVLRRLRAEGFTWNQIAAVFRLNPKTIIARAMRIGAHAPPPDDAPPPPDITRPPLPAGHPESWHILTHGTLLEGAPFAASGEQAAPSIGRAAKLAA